MKDITIAYIGGGSRGWARGFISDLALEKRICGEVRLYDIDYSAAKDNETIGNMIYDRAETLGKFKYKVVETIGEALTGADFVIISILPGTFDEMAVDVHMPEKYGIVQSVGDTVGPGGVVRALRTIPMFKNIALAIKKYSPKAWVINYTNPMAVCTGTLFKVFPEIKAFGCCHEVLSVKDFIACIYNAKTGENATRDDVKVEVTGINHFTWLPSATCKGVYMFPWFREYIDKDLAGLGFKTDNWMNKNFPSSQKVKFDLFKRYGYIAAAGDRHLCEFVPSNWYLNAPDRKEKWGYELTSVDWRKKDMQDKLQETKDILSGAKEFEIKSTEEEGVIQICALAGLGDYVTNVNVPNVGQIENLPLGAVVETNALFYEDGIKVVNTGKIPDCINAMVYPHAVNQTEIIDATLEGDFEKVYRIFINDPNMNIPLEDSRQLLKDMMKATKKYLPTFNLDD